MQDYSKLKILLKFILATTAKGTSRKLVNMIKEGRILSRISIHQGFYCRTMQAEEKLEIAKDLILLIKLIPEELIND